MILSLTTVAFVITRLAPGDPVSLYLGDFPEMIDPDIIEALRRQMQLDQPLWVQYLSWLKDAFTLNFRYSFITRQPVSDLLAIAICNTAKLMFSSFLISLIISIPIGVICAVRRDSKIDNLLRTFTLFGASMPAFWMAIILIIIFSVYLGWFPTSGMRTLGSSSLLDELWHVVLPMLVLSTKSSVLIMRLTRSGMLEALSKEYIITARSKGLRERVVVYKHALRNALLPIVTVIGNSIGGLLNGAVITETVFAWPGIGRLLVNSTVSRDYSVLMATVFVAGLLVCFANLITDISYGYLDPRIKYGE